MYNRYLPHGEYIPVEPEDSSSARPAQGGVLSFLSALLGPGHGERRESSASGLSGLLARLGLKGADGGDMLLILILVYLFRESEDEEWLIILALILLMGL